jgi:hypothetical protein
MSRLRPRLTVRWMMAAVVIAAWIALNMRIWLVEIESEGPPIDNANLWLSRSLAFIAAPAAGLTVALLVRRFRWADGLPEGSFHRTVFEWGAGGAAGWFVAMIAAFIGLSFDGFMPPFLFIYSVIGGVCSGAAGLLWAIAVWLLGPRKVPIPWIEDSMYLPEGGTIGTPFDTGTIVTSGRRPETARRADPKRRSSHWFE